jgi:hypothetical protein
MYCVCYALTFVFELFHAWSARKDIQSVGHEQGSHGVYLAWCRAVARYAAVNRHPLYCCVNRVAWEHWMTKE